MSYDLLTMEAGSGMDELMAISVMGWPASEWHQGEDGYKFRPSTNIAHAFEAVEKLTSDPCGSQWRFILEKDGQDQWRAEFGIPFVSIKNQFAPLAICRAALIVISQIETAKES